MKKVSFLAIVMAIVMVVGCEDKPFERDTKFEGTTPEVPADAVLTWRAIGDKDSVLVLVDGVAKFKTVAPKFIAGNCYIKQGTQSLEDNGCDIDTLQNSGKAVWNYNYNINDTIQYELGISVVVMRYNFATEESEMSNETIYPEVPMGIFMSLEQNHPAEATGFYEINVMRYTLASLNNPSLYCGKAVSKATIYEIAHDTTIVHDTTVVNPPTPDSTVVSRTAAWRHIADCGQWIGSGATRTMTLHCWCIESTTWSTGSVTKDSVLVPYTGQMTWSFPTYTTNQDGNYSANGNGCSALGATCSMMWTPATANIHGRTYAHNANCGLTPDGIDVVGTTATVNTVKVTPNGTITRTANYTLTINTPTPPPTTDTTVFGNIVYWSLTGTANAYSWTNVQWYINIITNDADGYHHRAALYTEGMSVSQLVWHDYGVMTTAEYNHVVSVSNFNTTNADGSSNAAQGVRRGLAVCKNSTAGANPGVSSTVKSDPNTGNNQVKYYSKSGSLIGACSAATGTIDGNNGGEPVRDGGVENHFPMGSQNVY